VYQAKILITVMADTKQANQHSEKQDDVRNGQGDEGF
jgi:hypothetical protein